MLEELSSGFNHCSWNQPLKLDWGDAQMNRKQVRSPGETDRKEQSSPPVFQAPSIALICKALQVSLLAKRTCGLQSRIPVLQSRE